MADADAVLPVERAGGDRVLLRPRLEFDLATYEQRTLLLDFEEELVSRDPLRIQLSIQLDDETLQLTYDERMDVVDENRQAQ